MAEHIAEHTAAHTGHHTQKYAEEHIVAEPGIHGVLYADDGENAQTGGVAEIQKGVIDAVQGLLPVTVIGGAQEHDDTGSGSQTEINEIQKRFRGELTQHHIPDNTAADCSGNAQNNHAEQVQLPLNAEHCTGNGKCHGTNQLNDVKRNVYEIIRHGRFNLL